ncbi:MAG TPA: Mur ligase family protein, partial [Rhodanobacteraceae bacterium]|nr:Mur ligase family protein [Rhodanobacteraceae bacterium]
MADRTLEQWLDYQQRVHARGIDLGLDRVREVWRRMGTPRIARAVITIGGTNGKGSTVAFLQAMLRAGRMRVGAYTSPHVLRYNERVKIDGEEAADEALIAAFERIETARGADRADAIPLTYFEFGTLAAFDIFSRANLDVALLEVGLGGRLDAVNLIDADAAIVTTVDLDHMEWLGNDRESIGREKAGIFRAGKPAIVGESDPPRSLIDAAHRIDADLRVLGRDFDWIPQIDAMTWRRIKGGRGDQFAGDDEARYTVSGGLALAGTFQYDNAAAAIAALDALGDRVEWDPRTITIDRFGSEQVFLPGRLQKIADAPQVIVDVAH